MSESSLDSPEGNQLSIGPPWSGSQIALFFSLYVLFQISAAFMGNLVQEPNNVPTPETSILELESEPHLENPSDAQQAEEEPSSTNEPILSPKRALIVFSTLVVLLSGLIFLILAYSRVWHSLHPEVDSLFLGADGTVTSCVKEGVIACLLWIPIHMIISVIWIQSLEAMGIEISSQAAIQIFELAAMGNNNLLMLTIFINVIFIAPILEELLFRGLLFRWLKSRLPVVPAIMISAAIFGGFHDSIASIFPITCLGAYLAWLFQRKGQLLTCITFHMVFNSLNISLLVISLMTEAPK